MTSAMTAKLATATRLPRYRRASVPPPMQLTARDTRIVRAVYEMRFLTRDQIQILEFAPSTASYCKRRLALLFHHGYLERKFIPAVGSFGSTRAIYCLAPKGARLVAHELGVELQHLDWRTRDLNRELYYLQHTLAINDFRIATTQATARLHLSIDWTDERTLRRREMKDYLTDPKVQGQRLVVVPDGYFRLTNDRFSAAFALEMDRATVEEKPFKTKIRAYGEWKRSGSYGRRYGSESLRVLFVIASTKRDPRRLARIKHWCEAEGGRSLFWFCPLDAVTAASILEAPIWEVAGRGGRHSLLSGGHT